MQSHWSRGYLWRRRSPWPASIKVFHESLRLGHWLIEDRFGLHHLLHLLFVCGVDHSITKVEDVVVIVFVLRLSARTICTFSLTYIPAVLRAQLRKRVQAFQNLLIMCCLSLCRKLGCLFAYRISIVGERLLTLCNL